MGHYFMDTQQCLLFTDSLMESMVSGLKNNFFCGFSKKSLSFSRRESFDSFDSFDFGSGLNLLRRTGTIV